ncbi:MAG: tryptophan--tRNA ligase [Erysipelothrix sp.]|nr:tryptophan--tRNA ligase [Erysipelothrix sp.]
MKKMISGIKPTGELHIGNYIGALRNFVKYQDDYDMYVFIANLHTITVPQDPIEINKYLKDAIALYLACGLDKDRSTIFLQSDVLEHANLGFILACHTYEGELDRMTQYKDKKAKGAEGLSAGFYTYPSLMAADILMYDADFVPVGDDQKQHVELTRDLAQRMNNRYGDLFTVPEPLISEVGARIMDLQDPSRKMSKSDQSDKGCIYLLDSPKKAAKKIMSAQTDSLDQVKYDPENQAGISNLLTIYAAIKNISLKEAEALFTDYRYGDFKKAVAEVVVELLETIQGRYNEIIETDIIAETLNEGKIKAQKLASAKLNKLNKTLGIQI